MRRIGLVGPWNPHDLVDLLLIRHLGDLVERDLGAELVLVAAQGREVFTWPCEVVALRDLLAAGFDGVLLAGDLGTSPSSAGLAPPQVWASAAALASAAGLPVAFHGVRLVGEGPVDWLVPTGAGVLANAVDARTAELLGEHAFVAEHPLLGLEPRAVDPAARSGTLRHASPAVLAAGVEEPGTWLALRPGRGDRLIGLPGDADRLPWSDPDEVLRHLAVAAEIVTDDPAIAALARSHGAVPRQPGAAASSPLASEHIGASPGASTGAPDVDPGPDSPERIAAAAWSSVVAHLRSRPQADATALVRAVRGRPSGPEQDTPESAVRAGSAPARRGGGDEHHAAKQARARADRWRAEYDRLRARRAVRLALRLSDLRARIRRAGPAGLVRAVLRRVRPRAPSAGGGTAAGRLAAVQRRSADRIAASVETSERTSGPLVSILVLTRNGDHHLRRLFPALEATRYRSFEVVIVDNGSGTSTQRLLADWLPDGISVRVLRNDHNATFGDANDQAAAVARGAFLLLLNDDVEPIEPGWLGHLVTTAERTGGAVGSRLIYPAATTQDNAGDSAAPPFSLQHRGIHFENWGDGVPRPRHMDARGDAVSGDALAIRRVPAATAACLLVPREHYDEVDGFTAGYDYGLEDVDLCLKLRAAGHGIVVDGATALWHHEFGTQNQRGADDKRRRRDKNRQRFASLWGPRLHREVLRDRILGEGDWSQAPLHVAITVSRLDEKRRHGDWYSAHELGDALAAFGWRVSYVERYEDRWYDLPRDLDVLVVMIDAFDLARVPGHLLTVAWVRNWTDRWVGQPWFDDFDLVFASSERSVEIIARDSAQVPVLLPLATDPERFRPSAAKDDERCDVVFVGSYWGEDRPVADVLARLADDHDVRLYGRGWDRSPSHAHLHRGVVAYSRLPSVLASAKIVLDDTASPTKPYEAVNTRVFDALACGALVLSDNPKGVSRRFDTPLPAWSSTDDAVALVSSLLTDTARRRELVEQGRREVLARHTYQLRAERFREELLRWVDAPRVDVLSGVPDRRVEHRWGDTHFARAFQRQLRRRGVQSRLVRLPEWDTLGAASADAVVHLFGLSHFEPRPGQVSLLWNISHPELVEPSRCERYDAVLVASDRFAAELRERVSVPVHVLHQATDPERFRPDPGGPSHDLLFVGNSRKVRRRILEDLLPTDLDLAIYGWGWTPELVDTAHVRAEHLPNRELGRHYAAAAIVLNDHWDAMREHAFVSNRLYDALAAGAFVISDHVEGIAELFDGGVVTYQDRDDLRQLVVRYLADPWERERVAARGRAAVLARHTFSHRADQVLDLLGERDALATVTGTRVVWERPQGAS